MNCLDAAVEVLRQAGEPLHYKEITERALKEGLWQTNGDTPENTVNAAITTDLSKPGSRFVRTARGVYGLREWGTAPPTEVLVPCRPDKPPAPITGLAELEAQIETLDPRPTSADESGRDSGTVYLRIGKEEFCVSKPDPGCNKVQVLRDSIPGRTSPERMRWLRERVDYHGVEPDPDRSPGRIHLWRALRRASIRNPGPGDVLAWFGEAATHPVGPPPAVDLQEILAQVRELDPRPTSADERKRDAGTFCLRIGKHTLCVSKPLPGSNRVETLAETLPGRTADDKLNWLGQRIEYHRTPPGAKGWIHVWRALRYASIRNPGPDDVLFWSERSAPVEPVEKDRDETILHGLRNELHDLREFLQGRAEPGDAERRLPFWIELCRRGGDYETAVALAGELPPNALDTNPRLREVLHAAHAGRLVEQMHERRHWLDFRHDLARELRRVGLAADPLPEEYVRELLRSLDPCPLEGDEVVPQRTAKGDADGASGNQSTRAGDGVPGGEHNRRRLLDWGDDDPFSI